MKGKKATLSPKVMVCLRMNANRGKSKTIKILAELLMPDPPKSITQANAKWFEPNYPKEIEKWPKKISKWPDDVDICVAVDVNGKRVGLYSEGDVESYIKKHLTFLAEDNCDVIFCASRSRNPTAGAVEKKADKYGYNLICTAPYTIDKSPPGIELEKLQEKLNRKKANHLKDFISWADIVFAN